MTNQEIIDYFDGSHTVYKFTGKINELQQLQETQGVGFNYIRVQDEIYFVTQTPAADSRISIITGD